MNTHSEFDVFLQKEQNATQAVKNLVDKIITYKWFSAPDIQRRLATLPIVEGADILVLEITKGLLSQILFNEAENCKLKIDHVMKPIKSLRDFDHFLALIGHKGHFLHQFLVFLLVFRCFLILKNRKEILAILKQFYMPDPNSPENDDNWERWFSLACLLTCMYHDLGYSVQDFPRISYHLKDLYACLGFQALADQHIELCEKYTLDQEQNLFDYNNIDIAAFISKNLCKTLGKEVGDSEISRLEKRLKEKTTACSNSKLADHGYLSALILCRAWLPRIHELSVGKKSGMDLLGIACAAIGLHSLKGGPDLQFASKIDFKKNPLAYLLKIADNFQDWNRTVMEIEDSPYATSSLIGYSERENNGTTDVKMEYILYYEQWDEKLVMDVTRDIQRRQATLNLLKGPQYKVTVNSAPCIRLVAEYQSNKGEPLGELKIEI